jgi:hypothetical protein
MDSTEGWSIDADLGIAPLEARGWAVEQVPWRRPGVDWNGFDAVYIGTPWDYPQDVGRFMEVLDRIDRSRAVLVNDFALVRWTLPKTYLRDLEQQGVDIVPSDWHTHLEKGALAGFFDRIGKDSLIIKPVVSTNATDTHLLTRESASIEEPALLQTFRNRAFVVQPFIDNIQTEGEYSLFYFGGRFSHAIRKVPKASDFRVQEEHGAGIAAVAPRGEQIECADRILALVRPTPVYARCDLVRGSDGRLLLMELELIEPSMYLRMHPDAPERFAAAFDRYATKSS